MGTNDQEKPSFFERLALAWRCFGTVFSGEKPAAETTAWLEGKLTYPTPPSPPAPIPPERLQASGLQVLAALQREGRLIDFLQEEVSSYPDADVGAAARVVHGGCRKILHQFLTLEPVLKESESAAVTVPAGFDAQQIRLTGNITGTPPFRGTLKHHGWKAREVRLPSFTESLDHRILAPAEVELP